MFDFYKTRMGMTFFEGTMPSLVRELKRLNDNLEADRKERAKLRGEPAEDDTACGQNI